MSHTETLKTLAAITDAGLFEQLASAVLREADPRYRSLIHTGVNTDGQTVKGPVDGIVFISADELPHMVTVHHTIGDRENLKKKWLHDPSTVKSKPGTKHKSGPGDILKTAQIYKDERIRTPNLIGTLVLTITSDPSQDVIRDAEAIARESNINIDFWPASRIAHFLDTDPNGQYIRNIYLGITQERLSENLLSDLSCKSIEIFTLPDDKTAWIDRSIDIDLNNVSKIGVVIVSAESGKGKSVACYKYLSKHIENNGYGLVLPHNILAESYSIEQAINKVLKILHPSLGDSSGIEALKLSSMVNPIVLVIEDINKSGKANLLLEKIAVWHKNITDNSQFTWQILCPVWPQFITLLNDDTKKIINDRIINCPIFSVNEGINAVEKRYEIGSTDITRLEAKNISIALGNDPLLIALHDIGKQPSPSLVIQNFINSKLAQLSHVNNTFTASEYLSSIQMLIFNMYNNRIMQPAWDDVTHFSLTSDQLSMLRSIASQGDVFKLIGDMNTEHIVFRHDRVRDWLAARTISSYLVANKLNTNFLSEPYYARVIGLALNTENITSEIIQRVKSLNPLALFYALQEFSVAKSETQNSILLCINEWLDEPNTQQKSNEYLRFECLNILATTDSPHVLRILEGFKDETWSFFRAGFRNGDLGKGIELCRRSDPGVNDSMHEQLIFHVILKNRSQILEALNVLLKQNGLNVLHRSGILRLCGYVADSDLYNSLQYAWGNELPEDRLLILNDYFWACAHCCGNVPSELLDPIMDVWASLPDDQTENGMPSDRNSFAAHEVRFAFHKYIPENAIEYLVTQSKRDELEWPITYMLHDIDHPLAVKHTVDHLAKLEKETEHTKAFFHFTLSVIDDWKRQQQDHQRPMSEESRNLLFNIWSDTTQDKYNRIPAFKIWSATQTNNDIPSLREFQDDAILSDYILPQRIQRNDTEAIPNLIEKISTSTNSSYWWQFTRKIWSDELTVLLDEELIKRSFQASKKWDDFFFQSDWIIFELIMKLSNDTAERILVKHWDHLQFTHYFIQAALYVASDKLVTLLSQAINNCPDPKSLFQRLTIHFEIKRNDNLGITRIKQLEVLLPYIDFLNEPDLRILSEVCNKQNWFDFRKKHLDSRLQRGEQKSPECYNAEKIKQKFNELIERKHIYWLNDSIDEFLKSGISTDDVLVVVFDWVKSQENIDLKTIDLALQVILNIGSRDDYFKLLDICSDIKNEYIEYFDNAYYLLQTRQLH